MPMLGARIDVREAVGLICRQLGLDPADVARLDIGPRRINALVYDAPKRIGPDGEPVTSVVSFEVQT